MILVRDPNRSKSLDQLTSAILTVESKVLRDTDRKIVSPMVWETVIFLGGTAPEGIALQLPLCGLRLKSPGDDMKPPLTTRITKDQSPAEPDLHRRARVRLHEMGYKSDDADYEVSSEVDDKGRTTIYCRPRGAVMGGGVRFRYESNADELVIVSREQ